MNTQIEIREETAAKLRAVASALHLSLDKYLARIADLVAPQPANGQSQAAEMTPYELVEDLIGSVDSSLLEDPAAPPHRPPMYHLVAEKLKKQGLKVS